MGSNYKYISHVSEAYISSFSYNAESETCHVQNIIQLATGYRNLRFKVHSNPKLINKVIEAPGS